MEGVNRHYFQTESGRWPVEDFIEFLDMRTQRKCFYKMELLEHFGRGLQMPHARHLKEGIFELRLTGVEGEVRILYFFDRDKAILTNGFIKKRSKTPQGELEKALERQKEYLKRVK